MSRGFTIKIFVPGNAAEGFRVVEKSNWSGRGIVCPRATYPDHKNRRDFGTTGVYILIGPSEESDLPTVYVGEGDPVKPRLDSHYAKKDFWTRAIFFVSKDENLNKAHIQHIESRLVKIASDANRCHLDNGNNPAPPNMSEMDVAEAEGFLDEILLCLPILGVSVFSMPEKQEHNEAVLYLKGPECEAIGYESSDGFVVKEEGMARVNGAARLVEYIEEIRQSLLSRGIFREANGRYVLVQDYTFNSPSQAAAVMLGSNINGRVAWKNKKGVTLKDLQEAQAND